MKALDVLTDIIKNKHGQAFEINYILERVEYIMKLVKKI